MKKSLRTVIIVIVAALLVMTAVFFIFVRPGMNSHSNSSRRDKSGQEYNADEDLLRLDGSLEGGQDDASGFKSSGSGSQYTSSMLAETVNHPLSNKVDLVRKVLLPEAVAIGEGDIGAFYSNPDFSDVIPVDIDSFSEKEIPSKYDSRDVDGKCYITEVEDQGYTSLCWAYSALGAVESDLLKHHDDINPEELDLSEKHLAYYNLHKASGSVNGTIDGDYRELVNRDGETGAFIFDYDTGYIDCGGVSDYCISLLTAWKGPVRETGSDAFKSTYGATYIFSDNADKPSDAYESLYHVQDVDQMPADRGNIMLVKQMIMEHGSATIGINSDSAYWKKHYTNMNSDFGSEPVSTADHEVLIIGWDDEYSASNFGIHPEGDGAFICKNSWGSKSGKDGFFYLSYYDDTANLSSAVSYNVATKGDDNWYDNNYQAAGFLTNAVSCLDDSQNVVRAYTSSANPYGMLYEVAGKEELKAIGLMAIDMYQQYVLEVYVNPEIYDDGISFGSVNVPVTSRKVSAISAGFHTFPLERGINLEKGDRFFVLVKPVTKGRLPFEEAEDMTGEPNYDEWNHLVGSIHNCYKASGNSYYIADDASSLIRQTDKDFFIKAYTVNR